MEVSQKQYDDLMSKLSEIQHQQKQFPNQIATILKTQEVQGKSIQKIQESVDIISIQINGDSALEVAGFKKRVKDLEDLAKWIKDRRVAGVAIAATLTFIATVGKAIMVAWEWIAHNIMHVK